MMPFHDPGGDPRKRFLAAIVHYGELGDAAASNPAGWGARKAGAAVAFARVAGVEEGGRDALAFAGTLHAIGALDAATSPRDVPVLGAQRCARIAALPAATAEIVRAQHERWDGTGVPDSLRWEAVPFESQLLLLADLVLREPDPQTALETVNVQSGRALCPRAVNAFVAWSARAAALEPIRLPERALREPLDIDALLAQMKARS